MIKIRSANVEVTTVCNASCPLCIRNRHFETWKPQGYKFPKSYLEINKFKALDWDNTDIECFILCGSFGDPILHPNLFELIDVIHNLNKKFILYTNGEPHDKNWWKELGNKCNDSDRIMFGVDGLDVKTHARYRGTSLNKITENIKAFISGGGTGGLQFIVFKYNQHQLSKINSFAESLGLTDIRIIKSRIYTDIFEKPDVEFETPKNVCYAEVGEPAIDVDAKLYICCYAYIRHYFGDKKIISYDTFENLKRSVYYKVLKEMEMCKTCRQI